MTYASRESSGYLGTPYELFLFQTQDEAWRYTSGDQARAYLGQTYTPAAIVRTPIDQNNEAKSGALTISLPRSNDLATRFVSYIPSTPVSLVIYRGHDGDAEVVTNFTGRVASARFSDMCDLEVVPEQEVLRRRVPLTKFQKPCNHILFDGGCGVDKALFRVPGTLSALAGDTITASAYATKPDGWFTGGFAEAGQERRFIIRHVGNTLTLMNAFTSAVQVGTQVLAYAGCQRNESDCKDKFSNLVNFMGFSKIPTRNPFDSLE